MKFSLSHLTWKDVIRFYVFPVLAALGHRIGFSWQTLGRSFLGRFVLFAQAKHITKSMKPIKADKVLDIYFLSMLGSHTHNISVDVVLALGLIQKGHSVTMVLDDMCLPINEDKKNGQESRWEEITARGYLFGSKYFDAAGLRFINLSSIIDKNVSVDTTAFEPILEASILKHYKVGVVSETLPLLSQKKELIKQSLNYSTQLGHYILSKHPDRVIMSHGIYATWGPPFEILDKHGIPVVTYSKTKRKKTEKFNWNYTGDWWDVSKEWEIVKHKSLTIEQEEKIDQYLKSRITHEEDVLVYNFGAKESKQKTFERFNLDSNLPVYALFTNVLWDAASAQREIVFKNPINWVFETIDYFIDKPHLQLLVKIHPAEVVIGTNQPFARLIYERFPNLPANIKIIEPQEEVNSWSIYEITTMGMVHTTTAGMELPLVGVPCAVVSRTHYRNMGFTIDVNSKEEYFNLFSSNALDNVDSEQIMTLSKRYAYLLFERYQMPFDVFDEVAWTDVRSLKFDNMEALFQIPYYERIIDAIINKEEFLTA